MPDTLAALSMLVIEVLSNLVVLDTASALGVAVNKGATQNSPPVRSRRKKIQKKLVLQLLAKVIKGFNEPREVQRQS
jgi:hypothetical protein